MADSLSLDLQLAKELWVKAWGHPWPHQSSGKISLTDISLDEGVLMPDDFDNDGDTLTCSADGDVDNTERQWEYTCLHNMQSVVKACGGDPALLDVLVVRREYIWLRETMENGYLGAFRAMVVTGQPGIGA